MFHLFKSVLGSRHKDRLAEHRLDTRLQARLSELQRESLEDRELPPDHPLITDTPPISTTTLSTVTTITTPELARSADPPGFGEPVGFTVVVTPRAPISASADGTSTLSSLTSSESPVVDLNAAVSVAITTTGEAVHETTRVSAGAHTIAEYHDTTTFLSSQATTRSYSGSFASGHPIRFTAAAAPVSPGAGPSIGSVTFMDGSNSLGTAPFTGTGSTVMLSGAWARVPKRIRSSRSPAAIRFSSPVCPPP